ncbi:hypothetical protein HWV62_26692 [Athelia sp. TMB]|nr:hypothetical protein HWV62_26692 [Athelia sp. TMB]
MRELDGFLVLMSVLSTVHSPRQGSVIEPAEQVLLENQECSRLVFTLTSEAMYEHQANTIYFRDHVGYEALFQAIQISLKDVTTAPQTLGFLLSLALHNFSISSIFSTLQSADISQIDSNMADIGPHLNSICQPGAIKALWDAVSYLPAGCSTVRYAVFKIFERLLYLNHRNQIIFSSLGIVRSIFDVFIAARKNSASDEKERHVLQRILRRTLDLGATTGFSRLILQKTIKDDNGLDADVLDVVRAGMKARWPEHFSLESPAAIVMAQESTRGLPATGFTFMIWLWVETLPTDATESVFSFGTSAKKIFGLSLTSGGKLRLQSTGNSDPYPKAEIGSQKANYTIGDNGPTAKMSWSIASAYLLSIPLVRFLTYEASTSLNMFLVTLVSKSATPVDLSPLVNAVKQGLRLEESCILFAISPASARDDTQIVVSGPTLTTTTPSSAFFLAPAQTSAPHVMELLGNIVTTDAACLDTSVWKIGGVAICLKLVQLAHTSHELSRTLAILTDGLRNNWQNSEDMERIRGYDILANILRGKCNLINLSSFEILFELLGVNFRTPEQSAVVNLLAYRAIALDFELWAHTRPEIQRMHLEHFVTLLKTSRFKRFNIKQHFAKLGLVRKLLFVLQTEWYPYDMTPFVVLALKNAAEANFTAEDAIKPIVSYLAANLHEGTTLNCYLVLMLSIRVMAVLAGSPHSAISRIDYGHRREKAEQVLECLLSILSIPACYSKFTSTLPLTRICVLLLGDNPAPVVATQVLSLIAMSLRISSSFSRKLELVDGWSILRIVVPSAWDPSVHQTVFDILLGRTSDQVKAHTTGTTVVCPNIVPTIFAALSHGLDTIAKYSPRETLSVDDVSIDSTATAAQSAMEALIEEIISLYASSPTFRQVFRSQQTTQILVDAYKAFVMAINATANIHPRTLRILEKVSHCLLTISLESEITGPQKREIHDTLQSAETIYDPKADTLATKSQALPTPQARRVRLSGRLSIQTGDRNANKFMARMNEWRTNIIATEKKRLRKVALDWKKLELQQEVPSSRVDGAEHIRDVQEPDPETQSIFQVEVPPWAETYDVSSVHAEDDQNLAEEVTDDKHRRVRHELEPGDVIEAVMTVARIDGVDSSPGLLMIGRSHLYMLDGLVENSDGEVIDAHDAPKQLFFVPGSVVELNGPQKAERCLEIYFKDSRSLLVVFLEKKNRLEMEQRLALIVSNRADMQNPSSALLKTPLLGRVGARMMSGFRNDSLLTAQRKWQAREISNFTYLSIINQLSGRTPSDATQYPIFPWVLKDYTAESLDLSSPEAYRDLTKPMGALTPARRDAAHTRYINLESVEEKPFHYGTHFSSSMIVCHFLIRMAPFTSMFKTLQGGDWDLPDRLFNDIARAYTSASQDVRGDVRELIPEFFTCPEFLENSADINFGVQQGSGERIHHVKLPPWAKQDPLLFITLNRKALESDYVSRNLPAWIDLIWGCKQRDPEALNVFHPLSYEGSIDPLEREATVGIIHNFGQTPRKVFNTPHPERFMHGLTTLPIGTLHGIEEDGHLLEQEPMSIRGVLLSLLHRRALTCKDLGTDIAVRELVLDTVSERIIPCPPNTLCSPSRPHEKIEWGPRRAGIGGAGDLRVLVDNKVVQVVEAAHCTCAAFADPQNLVTGSNDHTVRLWRLAGAQATLANILRAHAAPVVAVAASRAWSIAVSGSADGSAVVWDLNRGAYVRSIWHADPRADAEDGDAVHLVAINESTGYIATCSRTKLLLHTINARPMAALRLDTLRAAPITSLAFHEREYSPMGVLATGSADGQITLRTWGTDGTPPGERAKWEFLTMRVLDVRYGSGGQKRPAVTALKFIGYVLETRHMQIELMSVTEKAWFMGRAQEKLSCGRYLNETTVKADLASKNVLM